MERLEIALNDFVRSMEIEGLTPRQQLVIFDQASNLVNVAHQAAWDDAIKTSLEIVRERLSLR